MTSKRILLLRIEPTSYILALLRALRDLWPGEIEAQFVSANATQAWTFEQDEVSASFLPLAESAAIAAVQSKIATEPPDLVHAAGWGAPACWAAITAAHSAQIPVVVDLDTWQDEATGLRAVAKRFVLPVKLRRITHFAPAGQRQAAFLRRYGVPEAKITPVNMTVDVSAIRRHLAEAPSAGPDFRKRFGLPAGGQVVLFLARLVPEKGLEDLLDAWEGLVDRNPDLHLVIVGSGPMAREVEKRVLPRVHLLGRLSGEDVWNAYAAADVFVAPSRWEPWGLTINEAMSAGLPIVMTDAFGCIGDLAIADETACIVRAKDKHELSLGLEKVLRDDAYRSRIQEKASAVISDWTIEEEARRIVEIWQTQVGA